MRKLVYFGKRTSTGSLLLKEFSRLGYEIVNPNLDDLLYYTEGDKIAVVGDRDYTDTSLVLIRSMPDNTQKLLAFVMAMERNGAVVIDGSERVLRSLSSKAISSLERSTNGIPTCLPKDESEVPYFYPVIVKPVIGKFCRGIYVCQNRNEYLEAYKANKGKVIVQPYIDFEYENRVLVLNINEPEIIYVASKRNVARKRTKRKASYVPIESSVKEFVLANKYVAQRKGLIGYDIGTDRYGKNWIIEANYSPRFDRATEKLNMNIAAIVAERIHSHVV